MKIALDVEGVLADPTTPWLKDYNARYQDNLTVNDIMGWNFRNSPFKVSIEDFIVQKSYLWKENWVKIPPTEPDLSTKTKLLHQKHKVDIVSTSKIDMEEILKWLNSNSIYYSDSKFLDFSRDTSGKSHLNYDVFIDDNPLLANELTKKKSSRLLLYDRPWNRGVEENEYVKRVANFDQILKTI